MAIWSISASPLIMGNDLRDIGKESKAILLNRDAIAVSQDSLGRVGTRMATYNSSSLTQIWTRLMENGDVAVALYNKGDVPAELTFAFHDIGLRGGGAFNVRDIWAQKD